MTPFVSVAGPSGVGKTTLLLAVVEALVARGLRVAVVKHTPHDHPLDPPGKDTDRLRRAGALATALAGPEGTALVGPPIASPRELLGALPAVDLVLVEGWKGAALPRVEVHRRVVSPAFLCEADRRVMAVVSDEAPPRALPWLQSGDAEGLATWLCDRFGLRARRGAAGRLPGRSPVRSVRRGAGGGRAVAPGKRDRMARTMKRVGARAGARRKQASSTGRKVKARRTGTRSRSEAGRKGGQATLRRRGPEFFSEIGRKGGKQRGTRSRTTAAPAKRGGRKPARSRSASVARRTRTTTRRGGTRGR